VFCCCFGCCVFACGVQGACARPRKPVMTAIADAIQRGEPSHGPEACASVCAASPRYALRLAVIPGHEKRRHATRKDTKSWMRVSFPCPIQRQNADWLMSNYCPPRSFRVISYACATTPQFAKGRTSPLRSFRVISCRPLGPLSCLAQGDNPKDEAEPLPWPGRMPRATRRRLGFKMRSICRLRKFSWSRVSAQAPEAAMRDRSRRVPWGCAPYSRSL